MEHIKALVIKFVLFTIVLFVVFGLFYAVDFGDVLGLSLLATAIAYVLGDLIILPRYGNLTATIGDFIIAFLTIWLFGAAFIENAVPIVGAALIAAAILACGEYFYHSYIRDHLLANETEKDEGYYDRTAFNTETAEETDVHDLYDPKRAADEIEQEPKKRD